MWKKSIDDISSRAELIEKERDIRMCLASAKTQEAKEKYQAQLDYALARITNSLRNTRENLQTTLNFDEGAESVKEYTDW